MKNQITEIMETKGLDAILISGAREHNPSLGYFVGDAFFTQAEVLLRKGKEPLLFYRPMERDTAAATGLEMVCYNELPQEGLNAYSERGKELIGIMQYAGITAGHLALCGRVELGTAFTAAAELKTALPGIELFGKEGDEVLYEARFRKDPQEIEEILKLSRIVTTVVGNVEAKIAAGHLVDGRLAAADGHFITIGEIKAFINLRLGELGAENPEGTIFSQGRDAGVPHNQGNDEEILEAGKSIVYDFFPCGMGGGYFSDFTRTWCIGYAPQCVVDAYSEVKEIHDLCAASAKPGMKFRELQKLTCDFFKEHGHETILENIKCTNGYVHSVGHGLGLNIHERPFSGMKAPDTDVLLPGTVFTIEPGLYYPDGAEPFGVRIEDTYTMESDGSVRKLTEYPYDLVIPVQEA